MLCGGTLALNQNGELLAWTRKPGSQRRGTGRDASDEQARRRTRRRRRSWKRWRGGSRSGRIGAPLGGEAGLLAKSIPPLTVADVSMARSGSSYRRISGSPMTRTTSMEAAHGR